jgi:hypothetical protein
LGFLTEPHCGELGYPLLVNTGVGERWDYSFVLKVQAFLSYYLAEYGFFIFMGQLL